MVRKSRRNLLKGLAISAPAAWTPPFVKSVILPAHAQTSCIPALRCSTDDPTSVDPSPTGLIGAGTAWGWNYASTDANYAADICGLEARACPGTNVTIGIVDVVSPMGETADIGIGIGNTNPLTVQANASGVASFSECVSVALSGETVRFTLRFTSDDGSGPCDIPFCFTEFNPATACGP